MQSDLTQEAAADPTAYQATDELLEYLDFLEGEARQSQMFADITKAAGLACLGLGGLACIALPGVGIAAMTGGVAYLGTVIRQSRKTGRCMPVPFTEISIDSIARGMATQSRGSGEDFDDLLDYHYLTDRQKSDYVLLSLCAEEIGAALDSVDDPRVQRALWSQASRRFHSAYKDVIKENPDSVHAFADKSQVLQYVLATPEQLRSMQLEAQAMAAQRVAAAPTSVQREAIAATESTSYAPSTPQGQEVVPAGFALEREDGAPASTFARAQPSDPVVELKAIPNTSQRLSAFLQRCADDGFPIGLLSQHPFVWCYGVSQSGKSTMAHMLSVIRILQGRAAHYYSIDTDYPKEVKWDGLVVGESDRYREVAGRVSGLIGRSDKGDLVNVTYTFDEVYRAYTQKEISLQDLVAVVLQKGAKTRACVIGISQNDQLGANGLKDLDTAWKEERASVQAIAIKDSTTGQRQPTGQYIVTDEGKRSEWKLPQWLTPDSPDDSPVRIMLDIFPEARGSIAAPPSRDLGQENQPTNSSGIDDSIPEKAVAEFLAQTREAPDKFMEAFQIIECNKDDVLSSVDHNKDGATRLLTYLSENRRGGIITPEDVRGNQRNRSAGIDTKDKARDMLDMMALLNVCTASGDGAYRVERG